jgi:hypothetical protein
MSNVKGSEAEVTDTVESLFAAESAEAIKIGGFPPYYNPTPGEEIYLEALYVDERDPEFVRFVCRALAPVMCATGSKKNGKDEPVEVLPGDRFCVSNYVSLPIDQLMGNPPIPIKIIVGDQVAVASDARKSRWEFQIVIPHKYRDLAKQRVARFIPQNVPGYTEALPPISVVHVAKSLPAAPAPNGDKAKGKKGLKSGEAEQGL